MPDVGDDAGIDVQVFVIAGEVSPTLLQSVAVCQRKANASARVETCLLLHLFGQSKSL